MDWKKLLPELVQTIQADSAGYHHIKCSVHDHYLWNSWNITDDDSRAYV